MISPAAILLSFVINATTPPLSPVDLCGQCLTAEELPHAIDEALAGSAEQARALSNHFDQRGELDTGLFWSGIAVENGDEVSRYNYAYRLFQRGGEYDLRRAIYHLKILQKYGDSLATELRAEIEEKIASEK